MAESDKGLTGKDTDKGTQHVQNIKSLDLVRWIETQSELAYLR